MLSSQFIELLKLCQKYNIKMSHNEIATLCNLNEEYVKGLFELYNSCDERNRISFLEVLVNSDFITYPFYREVLEIITNFNPQYINELRGILNKENIVKLPNLMEIINIYNIVINNPELVSFRNVKENILLYVAAAEEIYQSTANPKVVANGIRLAILDKIKEEYEYFITNGNVIYFEDEGSEGVENDLEWFFDMKNKDKQYPADKLIRTIKPKHIPEKNNVIKVDFTRKD